MKWFFTLLFVQNIAYAKVIELYSANALPVENYKSQVEQIKAGDEVVFPNKTFRIIGKLGEGSTTQIYDIGEGKALRIPKADIIFPYEPLHELINQFVTGIDAMNSVGVPAVQLFKEESEPPFYLVVSKENILFLYSDYQSRSANVSSLSEVEIKHVEDQFLQWAQATAAFRSIGDIKPEQIAYTPDGWKIIDIAFVHVKAPNLDSGTIFSYDSTEMVAQRALSYGVRPTGLRKLSLPISYTRGRDLKTEVHDAISKSRVTLGLSKKVGICEMVLRWLK